MPPARKPTARGRAVDAGASPELRSRSTTRGASKGRACSGSRSAAASPGRSAAASPAHKRVASTKAAPAAATKRGPKRAAKTDVAELVQPHDAHDVASPPKRGRGRPRKTPLPTAAAPDAQRSPSCGGKARTSGARAAGAGTVSADVRRLEARSGAEADGDASGGAGSASRAVAHWASFLSRLSPTALLPRASPRPVRQLSLLADEEIEFLSSGRSGGVGGASAKPLIMELELPGDDALRGAARTWLPEALCEHWNMALLVLLYMMQAVPMGLTVGAMPFMLQAKLSYTQVRAEGVALHVHPFSSS
eukprot:359586-Chlamydomonas_euryale.AAC.8